MVFHIFEKIGNPSKENVEAADFEFTVQSEKRLNLKEAEDLALQNGEDEVCSLWNYITISSIKRNTVSSRFSSKFLNMSGARDNNT
ncbi:hypothetical protein NPIL_426521 [Nephila pilipes]|uniref:Uncharacterized protein n=1 Tax=Nephila pilipes TaxID=299642 RepID=A0A8X6PDU0_NEPPI|nr:hypothetical protein NPIL_426521 [Nephila pilipes]